MVFGGVLLDAILEGDGAVEIGEERSKVLVYRILVLKYTRDS